MPVLPSRGSVSAASIWILAAAVAGTSLVGAALAHKLLAKARDCDPGARKDAALSLSYLVGVLVFGLPGWLLSGVVRVDFRAVVFPLGGLAFLFALFFCRSDLRELGRAPRATGLLPLLVPLAVFGFFVWVRLSTGEIRQTEKPMDAAVLNAVLTSLSLPLSDPWLAGERFTYYHFGTYLLSLPFRAAGTPTEFGYNLLVAQLAAIAAACAFGAIRLRGGGRLVALFGALFLVLAGTFDGARQILAGTNPWDIDVWVSSRRVAKAITEWPFFTLRLGDLHPHALSIPILAALAGVAGRAASLPGIVLDAALLSALVSANPWDLPAGLLVLAAGSLAHRGYGTAILRCLGTLPIAALFAWPSLSAPRPPFQGLRLVSFKTTSLEAFLHLGGLVVIPALALGVALVRSRRGPGDALLWATVFPTLGIVAAVLTGRPVLGLAIGFVLAVLYLVPPMGPRPPDAPPRVHSPSALRAGFLLGAAATVLVAIPEVVSVVDSYGEEMHRMNTLFKCYSGAGVLFPIAGALLLPLVLATRRARWPLRILLATSLVGTLGHPVGAVWGHLRSSERALDGLAWMSREAPGDRAAIAWVRLRAAPGAVIAEAPGGAYSDHGRIGTHSGRPTVLGWAGHQDVWRGEAGRGEVDSRREALRTIFMSNDDALVRSLLARYRVAYVAVGPLEKKEYGVEAFPMRHVFRAVVDEGGTSLYDVRPGQGLAR